MAVKNIRFNYFKPCLEEDPSTEVDLAIYLDYLRGLSFDSRIMPYSAGHSIRLGNLTYHANYQAEQGGTPLSFGLWELVFNRMRPDVPGVTTLTRAELIPLDLEEDEYIAEDVTVLYDPELNYLVAQRNRIGAPPSAIQQFFNCMHQSDQVPKIELQIMKRDDQLQRALHHSFHHSINLRITNTRRSDIRNNIDNNSALTDIIHIADTLSSEQEYPVQAEFTLKIMSRNKENTFRHQAHNNLISLANRLIDTEIVDKLIVKGRIDEESPLEEVDLIQDVIEERIRVEADQTRFISSARIFDKLAIAYANRRSSLSR